MPSQNKSASARQSFLCEDLLYALCDSFALAVRKEQLLEVLGAKRAENELAVKILKNVADIGVRYLLHLVEDLLISLLGNGSFSGIAKAPLGNEELLEYVLKVQLAAPAPALCKGDEQKETFEKFNDCWNEYIELAEKAIFTYAFKLGARLTFETLCDKCDLS